jgi:hypothetical protein
MTGIQGMTSMTLFTRFRSRSRRCAAALAAASIALAAESAFAQSTAELFMLKFSEKEAAISDPTNTPLQNFLMWDLGAERVVARNTPYVELTNLHDSLALSEFHMSIGDGRFHFDCEMFDTCALVSSAPTGLGVTSSVNPTDADDPSLLPGDVLVLKFGGGGLPAGEAVRFRIALGVDDGYSFFHLPDYRTVLFDMNGINVYDGNLHVPAASDPNGTADNANLMTFFGTGGAAQIAEAVIEDFDVTGEAANYFNNNYRRYGIMERVDTFLALGQGAEIPEPSGAALAIVGLLSGLVLPRRRLRRAAHARQRETQPTNWL